MEPDAMMAQVDTRSRDTPGLRAPLATDAERWRQVLSRDPAASFLYAVTTTGIFCRPGCGARRPRRANAVFFEDARAAVAAGFRACLRCQPQALPAEAMLAERVVAYLDQERERTVPLAELARIAGCAPGTVQRVFTRVLGLSPRAWANARRAEAYRTLLAGVERAAQPRITDLVYAAGFSGPSRAHSEAPLGMQARRYRAQGAGECIGYVIRDSPLTRGGPAGPLAGQLTGHLLVAATARGVCAVLLGDSPQSLEAELRQRFPRAEVHEDAEGAALATYVTRVLAHLDEHASARSLPLDLRGTAFQARVWAALREIPRGTTCSYAQLAAAIGSPRAVRAVARACSQNPAAIVVPCHRVVGSDGKLTGYRWGLERKRALLAIESSASHRRKTSRAQPEPEGEP